MNWLYWAPVVVGGSDFIGQKAMSGSDKALSAELPLWSPWFRIIAEKIMDKWWEDSPME